MNKFFHRDNAGWTLAELLIAIAIIAILFLLVWFGMKTQIDRGYDARRKADLDSIAKAFEEYYNDHDCYPPEGILDNCGGDELQPYLGKIPCDPASNTPYVYVPENNVCKGHRVCAALKDKGDPVISQIGCDPIEGCGWGVGYNYCRGSGVAIVAPGFVPGAGGGGAQGGEATPTPSPTPSPGPTSTPTPTPTAGAPPPPPTLTPPPPPGGNYACSPSGQCNVYADPDAAGCPVAYTDSNCLNQCGDPANRCAN